MKKIKVNSRGRVITKNGKPSCTCCTPQAVLTFTVTLNLCDDGAAVYVNKSEVAAERRKVNGYGVTDINFVSKPISCRPGDIITVNVWDGWAVNWGTSGGKFKVFADGIERHIEYIPAKSGTSGAYVPTDPSGNWPYGSYWNVPRLNGGAGNEYEVFKYIVP